MEITIIICTTVFLCFVCLLIYDYYKRPYTEEIVEKFSVRNVYDRIIAYTYIVKRTYKQGTIKLIKRKYAAE